VEDDSIIYSEFLVMGQVLQLIVVLFRSSASLPFSLTAQIVSQQIPMDGSLEKALTMSARSMMPNPLSPPSFEPSGRIAADDDSCKVLLSAGK
jgi:hypothetical protein